MASAKPRSLAAGRQQRSFVANRAMQCIANFSRSRLTSGSLSTTLTFHQGGKEATLSSKLFFRDSSPDGFRRARRRDLAFLEGTLRALWSPAVVGLPTSAPGRPVPSNVAFADSASPQLGPTSFGQGHRCKKGAACRWPCSIPQVQIETTPNNCQDPKCKKPSCSLHTSR